MEVAEVEPFDASVEQYGSQARRCNAVIVNYQTWLPATENWIFTQTRCLPPSVTPYVVCGVTQNLERFAVKNLLVAGNLSMLASMTTLIRAAPKLGLDLTTRMALIARVAKRHHVRVVHSHFGYTAYYSCRALKKLDLRHVATFYGVDMSALPRSDPRWLDRYAELFDEIDVVLCEGPRMAEQVQALGCPSMKLKVHHLGVDFAKLPFQPRRFRRGETLRVLIAASFREKKGIPYAIEALGRLQKKLPLQCTIIGDAGRSPKARVEKARILEAVDRCGLASRVRFMGYQPYDVLLQEAYGHHVFLSPSVTASDGDTEGGAPVALIEMAATGMPVVSTRHADIPEVIVDGVTGLLAEERDVEGLEAQMVRLIESGDAWDDMTKAARLRVEHRFNAEAQGVALSEIYDQLVQA